MNNFEVLKKLMQCTANADIRISTKNGSRRVKSIDISSKGIVFIEMEEPIVFIEMDEPYETD